MQFVEKVILGKHQGSLEEVVFLYNRIDVFDKACG